jgi:hypothetical protein
MRLEGFVRVSNQSGEDYADAQTRLVVGRINLLDQIAELARRPHPYGRPGVELREEAAKEDADVKRRVLMDRAKMAMPAAAPAEALAKPKEIIKEGLSEYFLYTIEGTETIPNRWSKRLPCFPAKTVPVVNLFKYDDRRFGDQVVRFLLFRNDKQHTLGETPLPDGLVRVFRNLDDRQHLSYEGACPTQYIPVDQKCELNLGANRQVIVKPKLMDLREENFTFNPNGDISGWERVETWMVEVKNRRAAPARLEIKRHFPHPYWNMEDRGQVGEFRKDDADTIEYTLELPPNTERKIQYVVRFFEGERRERR